ncbi:ArsR family transcriptional regulator [Bacillus freudenreichii]|nr:ArsR family transcriptional regulator [Bacillus freudenreichii]
MLQTYQIENLDQVKAIADPLRIQILWETFDEAKTGKMIGDILNMPASKIHYHLRELEKNGLVVVERTEEKNGIVQKFYRPIARRLYVKSGLISPEVTGDFHSAVLESYFLPLKKVSEHLETIDVSVMKGSSMAEADFRKLKLSEEQTKKVKEKLDELQEMLDEFEQKRPDSGTEYVFQYEVFPYRKR